MAATSFTLAPPGAPGRDWTVTMSGVQPAPAAAQDLQGLGDVELVAVCLDGRTAAFDVVVERHRRAVYQLCYRFVPNHEDASDLSQEVFLRAFKALNGFRGQSSLATWLYRIAVNACLNRVSVKTPLHEPFDEQSPIESRADSPADRLLREEQAVRMRELVARLPAKQRATLVLRIYRDMSHHEIATTLGISVGAAKANVFHALRNLKRLMAMTGDDWR